MRIRQLFVVSQTLFAQYPQQLLRRFRPPSLQLGIFKYRRTESYKIRANVCTASDDWQNLATVRVTDERCYAVRSQDPAQINKHGVQLTPILIRDRNLIDSAKNE